MTFILGLTGSIGMGKSATAALFREAGVPVHDADATVHRLYRGPLAEDVEAAFPGTVVDGAVDRTRLGAAVLGSDAALRRLEAIVHPAVRAEEGRFVAEAVAAGAPVAVLDIPLLYETGGEGRCDAVCVVTTTPAIQAERVLARPGMTPAKFAAILAKQVPDTEKRRRSDFLVDTGHGFANARRQVDAIVAAVRDRPARAAAAWGVAAQPTAAKPTGEGA